jgi:hypothetical protein
MDQVEAARKTGQPAPDAPFIWRLYRLWKEWGVWPLEFIEWPVELVEGFQVCDVVEKERNLPVAAALTVGVSGGGADWGAALPEFYT